MARRRTTARKRKSARRGKARPKLSLDSLPRLPELEQRHLDLIGLALVALGTYFAFVLYLGWDGGKVGGLFGDAFVFLFGGVAYLVPVVLLAAGTVLVLKPMLPSVSPFRSGG